MMNTEQCQVTADAWTSQQTWAASLLVGC